VDSLCDCCRGLVRSFLFPLSPSLLRPASDRVFYRFLARTTRLKSSPPRFRYFPGLFSFACIREGVVLRAFPVSCSLVGNPPPTLSQECTRIRVLLRYWFTIVPLGEPEGFRIPPMVVPSITITSSRMSFCSLPQLSCWKRLPSPPTSLFASAETGRLP